MSTFTLRTIEVLLGYFLPMLGGIYYLQLRKARGLVKSDRDLMDEDGHYIFVCTWPVALPFVIAIFLLWTAPAWCIVSLARWHAEHYKRGFTDEIVGEQSRGASPLPTPEYKKGFADGVEHARREMRP